MIRAVYLQVAATVIVVLIMGGFAGARGAVSAGLGGAACILPNAWFALRLTAASKRGEASAFGFLFGEVIKIAATIGLLVTAVMAYPDVHWPGLLIGMVVALQASFFAIWKKS